METHAGGYFEPPLRSLRPGQFVTLYGQLTNAGQLRTPSPADSGQKPDERRVLA